MKNVVVFCGASMGHDRVYYDHAYTMGRILASNGITIVFGGGKVGMMGAVAEGALHHDGRVVGVIPDFLCTKEIAHEEVSQLIVVESMHERKMKMHELSDAIIALPGGWGTMEELFEMMTWAQLGLHSKPIGILNVNGFYDPFIQLVDKMIAEGFLRADYREMLVIQSRVEDLISAMQTYVAPQFPKIVDASET